MENNLLFCVDCFGALYGATCHGCSQRIGGDELWVEALEHTWHPACFVCDVSVVLGQVLLVGANRIRKHVFLLQVQYQLFITVNE